MADKEEFNTSFKDKAEELQYWKDQAHHWKRMVCEVQDEMAEFTLFSKDLERELEYQLEENEKEIKELRQKNTKLNLECDSLKEKTEKQQQDHFQQLTELQEELEESRTTISNQTKYIREIEQLNDDLERTKRATIVSIEDFEQRLNHAIERNAFLESELDEKEAMAVTVQRLRDEARDLSQELVARQRKDRTSEKSDASEALKSGQSTPRKPISLPVVRTPSSHEPASPSTPTSSAQMSTPAREQNGVISNTNLTKGTPLTPSARISALNIVGELLRKVGALESKLASCRNSVRDQPSKNPKSSSVQKDSLGWDKQKPRSNGNGGLSQQTTVKMCV